MVSCSSCVCFTGFLFSILPLPVCIWVFHNTSVKGLGIRALNHWRALLLLWLYVWNHQLGNIQCKIPVLRDIWLDYSQSVSCQRWCCGLWLTIAAVILYHCLTRKLLSLQTTACNIKDLHKPKSVTALPNYSESIHVLMLLPKIFATHRGVCICNTSQLF